MAGKTPTTDDYAKVIWRYANALVATKYKGHEPKAVEVHAGPVFGDKETGKKKKKKKKNTIFVIPDGALKDSLHGPLPTEAELAELAEQAKLAKQQAEELAGEPLAYVAAMLVPARLISSDSPLRDVEEYKIINGW